MPTTARTRSALTPTTDLALKIACTSAGLVDATGRPTVSAHRFRHTIGTQLAEGGARLQTIVAVLGHKSPAMSLICASLSAPTVKAQYQAALERKLGHCLRLPAEGPCECDLVLSCSKFLTTSAYAPRLRAGLGVEEQLIADATERGWAREVERHETTRGRLQALLNELGDPEPQVACTA